MIMPGEIVTGTALGPESLRELLDGESAEDAVDFEWLDQMGLALVRVDHTSGTGVRPGMAIGGGAHGTPMTVQERAEAAQTRSVGFEGTEDGSNEPVL